MAVKTIGKSGQIARGKPFCRGQGRTVAGKPITTVGSPVISSRSHEQHRGNHVRATLGPVAAPVADAGPLAEGSYDIIFVKTPEDVGQLMAGPEAFPAGVRVSIHAGETVPVDAPFRYFQSIYFFPNHRDKTLRHSPPIQ